jgi:hypothetical protein
MEFSSFEIAIAFAMTLFGIVAISMGAKTVFLSVSSKKWGAVDGVVTVSRRAISTFGAYNDDEGALHFPLLKYEYTIEGKQYAGTLFYFGWWVHGVSEESLEVKIRGPVNVGKEYADEVVQRFPEGSRIKVYVSPQNASLSVLEPGLHKEAVLLPLFGILFSGVGLYLLSLIY